MKKENELVWVLRDSIDPHDISAHMTYSGMCKAAAKKGYGYVCCMGQGSGLTLFFESERQAERFSKAVGAGKPELKNWISGTACEVEP